MAAPAAAAGAVQGPLGDPLARSCERDGWVERRIERHIERYGPVERRIERHGPVERRIERYGPVERAAQSRVVKHTLIEHEPTQLLQPAHAQRVSKVAGTSPNPNAVLLWQSTLAHVAEEQEIASVGIDPSCGMSKAEEGGEVYGSARGDRPSCDLLLQQWDLACQPTQMSCQLSWRRAFHTHFETVDHGAA